METIPREFFRFISFNNDEVSKNDQQVKIRQNSGTSRVYKSDKSKNVSGYGL